MNGIPEWLSDILVDEYNSYDNAILFNDYVVSSLIKTLNNAQNKSLLIYLSDHGEEVYDNADTPFCGRSEASPSSAMYTVPFFTWASPALNSSAYSSKWKEFQHRPFITSDFIHTLPDMIGIEFDGLDLSRSLISEQYIPRKRKIGNPDSPSNLIDYDRTIQSEHTPNLLTSKKPDHSLPTLL